MGLPFQVTFDCADAEQMSAFWSVALDYEVERPPVGYLSWSDYLRANQVPVPPPRNVAAIVDPGGHGPRLLFLQVPPTTVQRRIHLDLHVGGDDPKQAKITQLEQAGAVRVRRVDEGNTWWVVMADPEGNEFCVT